jgi:uncharacterized protein GlcG (DUF336 family)
VVVSIKRLSLETAKTIAEATLAECRKQGVQIAVTVIDRGGHPQVVLRDVLAPDLTLGVSRDKAYTALSFAVPTSQLSAFVDTPLGRREGLMILAGGLPISAAGELMGAVGVSGAFESAIDEACAQAGIDAVKADLEMSGL